MRGVSGRLFQAVEPATANAPFASRLWVTLRNDVMFPCSRSEAAVGAGNSEQRQVGRSLGAYLRALGRPSPLQPTLIFRMVFLPFDFFLPEHQNLGIH